VDPHRFDMLINGSRLKSSQRRVGWHRKSES